MTKNTVMKAFTWF